MVKKGRPFVYQSEEEKPVTVSLRLPRDVYRQVERYVKMRPGMTLTEFFREGARLRLDTPTDPRDIISSDDNTVIRELEEMVEAAVRRALAKERTVPPALDTTTPAPAPEAPAQPNTDLASNGNTVLQEEAPRRSTRRGGLKLTPQQEAALRAKKQQGTPIKALMEEYGISKATVFRYLE
jgi:hypothetical protein